MSSIPEILDGFAETFESHPAEVFAYVPDSIIPPAVCVYCEQWPYDTTADATFILLCVLGTGDMQDAQAQLMGWLSDTGPTSLVALIDADNTLDGAVSSVLPFEVRNWGLMPVQEGRPRLLQAELVCHVLR